MDDSPEIFPGPDDFPSDTAELLEQQAKAYAASIEALPQASADGAPFDPRYTWESFAAPRFGENIRRSEAEVLKEWFEKELVRRDNWRREVDESRREKDRELLRRYEEREEKRRKAAKRLEESGWGPIGVLRHLLGVDDEAEGGVREGG